MDSRTGKVCLECRRVSVRFHRQWLLKDISLKVEDREIVSVIGPNGAGKTTLFNVISGRIHPTSGEIRFHGENITHWPPHRICRSGLARTFQIARPFPEMTVRENVLVGLRFGAKGHRKTADQDDEAWELLKTVGLEQKGSTVAKDLTLSEKRRLEVARALSTHPTLVLLDEMAAGLSPQAISQAMELIKALSERGLTLLIVDHFLNLTARVSDRLVALDHGEKILEGKASEVMRHPEVVSAYLGKRQQGAGSKEYS
jgi:branched-chain amino acid transport system ATP-binding protein